MENTFSIMKLDEKDQIIINCLQQDAKMHIADISQKTGIPTTTVHNRIKKLEKDNILNFTISLNRKLLYGEIIAFILLQVADVDQKEVVKILMKHEEVEETAIVTGDQDIILRVRVPSIDGLNNFILNKLRKISGITNSTSMISLEFYDK